MLKRIFDIVLSLIGLIIVFPLFMIVAIAIKISSKGSVLFLQVRIGKNGKPFTIYKFRTMIVNHGGNSLSVKGEKRITPLGSKLRRYKLDELPELWNILKGDMSFVGPRPDMPEYAAKLSGDEKLILKLRPGLTCPASLKYSNEEELLSQVPDPLKYNDEIIWPDKVKMNLEYYYKRSFCKDLKIMLQTLKVIG